MRKPVEGKTMVMVSSTMKEPQLKLPLKTNMMVEMRTCGWVVVRKVGVGDGRLPFVLYYSLRIYGPLEASGRPIYPSRLLCILGKSYELYSQMR